MQEEFERNTEVCTESRKRLEEACRKENRLQEKELDERDEVRQLRYRNHYLTKELQKEKELGRETASKTKASLAALRNALETVEKQVRDHSAVLQDESTRLQSLVVSLQRHLGRGYHAVPSHTAKRLLDEIHQASTSILGVTGAYHEPSNWTATASRAAAQTAKNVYTAHKEQLSQTMADICTELEIDNTQLRAQVAALESQVGALQEEAKAATLIPQYVYLPALSTTFSSAEEQDFFALQRKWAPLLATLHFN